MATLASATLAAAKKVTNVWQGKATGGGATTLIDTAMYDPPADDVFNYGTIWFTSGSRAATTGTSNMITDWDQSAFTATFATGTAVAANDRYAICLSEYPLYVLQQKVNDAYYLIGKEDQTDASTTSVANQMNYDLPSGVYNVKRIEIATSTSAPYNYLKSFQWYESGADIYFDELCQPTSAGYLIRMTYNVPPSELTADNSTISNYVNQEWLAWEAAYLLLEWRLGQVGQNAETERRLARALSMKELHRKRYQPILDANRIAPDPHLAKWGIRSVESPEYTGTVRLS